MAYFPLISVVLEWVATCGFVGISYFALHRLRGSDPRPRSAVVSLVTIFAVLDFLGWSYMAPWGIGFAITDETIANAFDLKPGVPDYSMLEPGFSSIVLWFVAAATAIVVSRPFVRWAAQRHMITPSS
jgi:hypothetical protein